MSSGKQLCLPSISNSISIPTFDKNCNANGNKNKDCFDVDKIDLIVSPAMGGVVIGSKIGELLNKKSIFLERVDRKFTLEELPCRAK